LTRILDMSVDLCIVHTMDLMISSYCKPVILMACV